MKYLIALAVAGVTAVICGLLAGSAGAVGSVIGSALVLLFFLPNLLNWGNARSRNALILLEPLMFVFKIVALLVVLSLVTTTLGDSIHLPSLAGSVIVATFGWIFWLIYEAKTTRQPLYDLDD